MKLIFYDFIAETEYYCNNNMSIALMLYQSQRRKQKNGDKYSKSKFI